MNETLQNMFRNVTDQVSQLVGGYLPNLLGALGILVIGWLVAVVVAAVVRGALKRTTIDNRIAAWMGASQGVEVERYAGKSAYWFIMCSSSASRVPTGAVTDSDRLNCALCSRSL